MFLKLAIALSGGKDSLTLLFLIKAIAGRGFPKLDLYRHSCIRRIFLRSRSQMKTYLKAICEDLEVQFLTCKSTQKLETLECYSCSRERRRLIFDAAKSVGATTIAFGHHRDDQCSNTSHESYCIKPNLQVICLKSICRNMV